MYARIEGEKWECTRCGRYFYIQRYAGELMGANCPFCWQRIPGKFIKDVRIIL